MNTSDKDYNLLMNGINMAQLILNDLRSEIDELKKERDLLNNKESTQYQLREDFERENARLKAEIKMLEATSRGHSTSYLYQSMSEENLSLKAEVQRLTNESSYNFRIKNEFMRKWGASADEVKRLNLENDKLRTAGNSLLNFAYHCLKLQIHPKTAKEKIDIWERAINSKH